MDLTKLAKQFPDLCVTVRLGDLLEAGDKLARRIREEAQRDAERARRQWGDVLVPKEEARQMLGSPDPSTLWRWEKAGYLSPVRIGVRVHYRRSDIDALVRSRIESNTKKHA